MVLLPCSALSKELHSDSLWFMQPGINSPKTPDSVIRLWRTKAKGDSHVSQSSSHLVTSKKIPEQKHRTCKVKQVFWKFKDFCWLVLCALKSEKKAWASSNLSACSPAPAHRLGKSSGSDRDPSTKQLCVLSNMSQIALTSNKPCYHLLSAATHQKIERGNGKAMLPGTKRICDLCASISSSRKIFVLSSNQHVESSASAGLVVQRPLRHPVGTQCQRPALECNFPKRPGMPQCDLGTNPPTYLPGLCKGNARKRNAVTLMVGAQLAQHASKRK